MTLNEVDHNSSHNPQFSKSNYHLQLSKSLFRHYNKSAQALQKSGGGTTPDFVYQEPKLLNQPAYADSSYDRIGNGYFVDRGAISVPSSRIETFYTDKSIEEEVHNFMQHYEGLHSYDQGVHETPSQPGSDGYRLSSNEHYDQNVQPVYEAQSSQEYQSIATRAPQCQNLSGYNAPQGEQNQHFDHHHNAQQQQQQQQFQQHATMNNLHQQQAAHQSQSHPKQIHQQQYQHIQPSFSQNYSQSYNSYHAPTQASYVNNPHKQSNDQYPPRGSAEEHTESRHLPTFQNAPQQAAPANNDTTKYPHALSATKETTFEPKVKAKRGRPRKKPGFHLKLDGINKRANLPNRLVSSSQSDSGTDYWNRTPGGLNHGPSRLSMSLAREDFDVMKEMELNDSNVYGSVPGFNLTPSVDPPAGAKSYFELNHTPGVDSVANGSYFSPAIGVNAGVNNFNQSFEVYLDKADDFATAGAQHDDLLDSNIMGFPIPEFREENIGDGQQEPIKDEFTPLGLSIDPYVSQNESSPGKGSGSGAEIDNYSQSTYSADINHFNIDNYINSDEDQEIYPNPSTLHRTTSNHSVHSVASAGSDTGQRDSSAANKTHTSAAKKKGSKGAKCPVCDKFISRDLTRHMRIHNEIGRFQCVYPREMCNHKTQNFNRPYDYKKHLLHSHFKFDDSRGKTAHTLGDKLPLSGECIACGARYLASEWLSEHVLTKNERQRCIYVDARTSIEQS
ncbi:hypothetical protein CANMA_002313 [Candida margitis]|uniref:uncharacterized protein n=1 Tax=Candida margitis TaxID=1775924 RepID=UPI002226A4E5|nr:uncharacterized protein CANMA_002313 [Candida margitis]KAI5968568.1 hypothetical protein CANMA_002313 [Candida margitis]